MENINQAQDIHADQGASLHTQEGQHFEAAVKSGHVPQFNSPAGRAEHLILQLNMAESIARAEMQAAYGDEADLTQLAAAHQALRDDVAAVMAFELHAHQRSNVQYMKGVLASAHREPLPEDFDAATFATIKTGE